MSRGGVSYSSTHGLGSSVMDGGYGEEKEKGACRSQTHEPAQGFSLSLPPKKTKKKSDGRLLLPVFLYVASYRFEM